MRLQMKQGTRSDQMKISLNGYDLRVEYNNKVTSECGRQMSEHFLQMNIRFIKNFCFLGEYSYHQVTLFSSCEVDQLTTEFKDDGCLHIQVPINL
jgi:hypothetical protein